MKSSSLFGHLVEILSLLERTREPFDKTVAAFFRSRTYLGSTDRKFLSTRVYGITRYRRYVEAVLEEYLAHHPGDADLNRFPERFLPVIATYQALFEAGDETEFPSHLWTTYFPRIDADRFRAYAASNRELQFLGDDIDAKRSVRHSYQDWMVDEWDSALGSETELLLGALNQEAPVTLRVNLSKTSREACRDRLRSEGLECTETSVAPGGLVSPKRFNAQILPSFRAGWFEVQDEGSQIVSLLADPPAGSTVIDGCAGAGGKSLHLADLMHDTGKIVAVDVDRRKLGELRVRAGRGGYKSIETVLRDDFAFAEHAGSADVVLVDAPCSGSGTIRRNPALKWRLKPEMLSGYREKQEMLLDDYARCVKSGGRLVYSTCSLFREENEGVVERFLGTHPEFSLPIGGESFPQLADGSRKGLYHCYPHRTGTDGFFIAVMQSAPGSVASSAGNS